MKRAPGDCRFEPLGDHHDRRGFSCGVEALDRYLRAQAAQDVRKKAAAVFVLTSDGRAVAGYYTLSAHAVALESVPAELARMLPLYPVVPTTLLGRLAVSEDYRGLGFGEHLLVNAMERALAGSIEVASAALVVDAKDERARSFYLRYGFLQLPTQPNRLLLPMKTIAQLFTR